MGQNMLGQIRCARIDNRLLGRIISALGRPIGNLITRVKRKGWCYVDEDFFLILANNDGHIWLGFGIDSLQLFNRPSAGGMTGDALFER